MNGRYGCGIGDEEEKYKLRVSVIDKGGGGEFASEKFQTL
jgi:hypothetical protein